MTGGHESKKQGGFATLFIGVVQGAVCGNRKKPRLSHGAFMLNPVDLICTT